MAGLSGLDVIVILLVLGAGVLGAMRGFVSEAMALLAWVAAVAAVRMFHPLVASALVPSVGSISGAAILAFAVIFGVVFFVVRMVGRRWGRATRQSLLGPFDRFLGLGLGAAKGLLAATLLFLLLSLGHDVVRGGTSARPEWMTASRTYPLLRASAAAVSHFVASRRAK